MSPVKPRAPAPAGHPAALPGNSISRKTILARLAQIWKQDPKKVATKDPIGKYIKGGAGVMAAYWTVLNDSVEFKPDGLKLQTSDTSFVTTVGQLVTAIATWYSTNNWAVTA
jgi:hypothetical protein